MAKKSKSKKSKSKNAKSEAADTESKTSDAVLARSVDEVYNLLNAVNEQTLARMEKQVKDVNEITLKRIEDKNEVTRRYLVNDVTLKLDKFQQEFNAVHDTGNQLFRLIQAIKAKTDRLP